MRNGTGRFLKRCEAADATGVLRPCCGTWSASLQSDCRRVSLRACTNCRTPANSRHRSSASERHACLRRGRERVSKNSWTCCAMRSRCLPETVTMRCPGNTRATESVTYRVPENSPRISGSFPFFRRLLTPALVCGRTFANAGSTDSQGRSLTVPAPSAEHDASQGRRVCPHAYRGEKKETAPNGSLREPFAFLGGGGVAYPHEQ